MSRKTELYSTDEFDVAILPRSGTLFMSENPRERHADRFQKNGLRYVEANMRGHYLSMGDFKILPNGADNRFPENFKELLDSVYLGGVKSTLVDLALSGRPIICKEVIKEGKVVNEPVIDNEISDWLDSWRFYEEYLDEIATDMVYVENGWTAMKLNRGARFGLEEPKITALEHFGVEDMRLGYAENGRPKKAYMADWGFNALAPEGVAEYPLFDYRDPFRHPISFAFEKTPTFASKGYGRPRDIGATQQLRVLSLLPNYHYGNLTQKGFKWVVYIDQNYYIGICEKNNWKPDSKEFREWKKDFLASIDTFLISEDGSKVQTRFQTEFRYNGQRGDAMHKSVHIEKLEDDTKDQAQVGLDLHDSYSVAYTSALGISPKLANLNLKNHALSGSDVKEEYEKHIRTTAPRIRNKILSPVNAAIRANWPKKRLKIAFQDSLLITPTQPKTNVKEKQKENDI